MLVGPFIPNIICSNHAINNIILLLEINWTELSTSLWSTPLPFERRRSMIIWFSVFGVKKKVIVEMDYNPQKPSTKQMGISIFPVYFISLMLGSLALLIIGKTAWWYKNSSNSYLGRWNYKMSLVKKIDVHLYWINHGCWSILNMLSKELLYPLL